MARELSHPLAKLIQDIVGAAKEVGWRRMASPKKWLVLSDGKDPFWFDRPAAWRDGQWLADTKRAVMGRSRIHPRGLHYVFLSRQVIKPDGLRYGLVDDALGINNLHSDWVWLGENAIKSARWLGLIPFDEITDERNDAPEERLYEEPFPHRLWAEVNDEFQLPNDVLPTLHSQQTPERDDGQEGLLVARQPYHLVFIGEKSSLYATLAPLAERYRADLYLPTGEISDYYVFRIAANAVQDGRPCVILYFADCDPSGHQMCISVTRKLQALQHWEDREWIDDLDGFGELELIVDRAALTPRQVSEEIRYTDADGNEQMLPQSPVTQEDRRRENWSVRYGVEQTEIDALLALAPDVLPQLVADAVQPYFDETLDDRVREAEQAWLAEAQRAIDEHLGGRDFSDLQQRLGEIREELPRLASEATERAELNELDLPERPDTPEPELDGELPEPLYHSAWDYMTQTRRLQYSKRYVDGGLTFVNGMWDREADGYPVNDDETDDQEDEEE